MITDQKFIWFPPLIITKDSDLKWIRGELRTLKSPLFHFCSIFRSHTQLLCTPWPHWDSNAPLLYDRTYPLPLWSPHSWTDTCLFQLYLIPPLTDTFQTVRNSMFFNHWASVVQSWPLPGKQTSSFRPLYIILNSKFWCSSAPFWWKKLQHECSISWKIHVIFYSVQCPHSKQDGLWLHALHKL